MKAPPIKRIESCKYCLDKKGRPKPIWPEDLINARKMPDGSYKCQKCQVIDLLKLNGYNSWQNFTMDHN
jgi:hypothetical protein